MKLDDENIELYLFRYKEGMLSSAERAEVERALVQHPEWKAMADSYDPEMKLVSGEATPWEGWESLRDGGPRAVQTRKRPVVLSLKPRIKVLSIWLSAAACLILLMTTVTRFVSNRYEMPQGVLLAGFNGIGIAPQERDVVEDDMNDTISVIEKTYPVQRTDSKELLVASNQVLPLDPSEPDCDVVCQNAISPEEIPVAPVQEEVPSFEEVEKENESLIFTNNLIEWETADSVGSQPASRSLRSQFRHLALKATSVIANAAATFEDTKESVTDALEEKIQSNQFISNLIAALQ